MKNKRIIMSTEIINKTNKIIDDLYDALIKPKGIKFRLLKLFFPEIRKIADVVRKTYWEKY